MNGSSVARAPRLWVIDPSVHEAEDQGIEQLLAGWPGEYRLFFPALEPGDGPASDAGYDTDGVVLLGSAASVYDDHPWLVALAEWMTPLLNGGRDVPVLGICFGHQLIGHLAGAPVIDLDSDGTKRLGVEESRFSGGRLLPGEHSVRTIVSHRETVAQAPARYRVVARRPGVEVDGMEHEQLDVYSFQFHPEARDQFAGRRGIDLAEIDARLVSTSGALLAAFRQRVLARARAG